MNQKELELQQKASRLLVLQRPYARLTVPGRTLPDLQHLLVLRLPPTSNQGSLEMVQTILMQANQYADTYCI